MQFERFDRHIVDLPDEAGGVWASVADSPITRTTWFIVYQRQVQFFYGGQDNSATGMGTTVGGGGKSVASGYVATVPGGGNNTAANDYWVRCIAALAIVPVVTVAIDDANPVNVVLTWTAHPNNARYEVWISIDPYFDPDNPGGVIPIVTAATTYTDPDAAADPMNRFYVVRGLNACVVASANPARKGEFTFELTPGTS